MREIFLNVIDDQDDSVPLEEIIEKRLFISEGLTRYNNLRRFKNEFYTKFYILITKPIKSQEFIEAKEEFENFCIKCDKHSFASDNELF
jgi:hypothetical protein